MYDIGAADHVYLKHSLISFQFTLTLLHHKKVDQQTRLIEKLCRKKGYNIDWPKKKRKKNKSGGTRNRGLV